MPENSPVFEPGYGSEASFGNTDWWTVRQAGQPEQSVSEPARSTLCRAYWKPVFQFILRRGYSWHDAQDLTQEFFSRLLKQNSLRTADQERGRFRAFLLTLVTRFLADQKDRERCQKRGGGARILSLEEGDTEFRCRIEPRSDLHPEKICERRWVDSLVDHALAQLEQECAERGKGRVFRELREAVTGESDASYASAADRLAWTEGNVRVTVHRLRQRLRELLSEAMADRSPLPSKPGQELLEAYSPS